MRTPSQELIQEAAIEYGSKIVNQVLSLLSSDENPKKIWEGLDMDEKYDHADCLAFMCFDSAEYLF